MRGIEASPDWWRRSPETVTIIEALAQEAGELRSAFADLVAQCDVATATWGLDRYEQELGLPVDNGGDPAYRRARILAKLRGVGATTVSAIADVAASFTTDQVKVLEDKPHFQFEVRFVGFHGLPPGLDALSEILDEIKPAHLVYDYACTMRQQQPAAVRIGIAGHVRMVLAVPEAKEG